MDLTFDKKLDTAHRIPETFRGALVDCTDTLDFCWAAVRAVFGDAATPEHALALLPQVMLREEALRRSQAA